MEKKKRKAIYMDNPSRMRLAGQEGRWPGLRKKLFLIRLRCRGVDVFFRQNIGQMASIPYKPECKRKIVEEFEP